MLDVERSCEFLPPGPEETLVTGSCGLHYMVSVEAVGMLLDDTWLPNWDYGLAYRVLVVGGGDGCCGI